MEISLIYKFKYYKIHLYVLFIIYIVNNVYCLEYILFRMCVFTLKHLCFFFMIRIKLCPYRSPEVP